jgi:hypothetical protein
VQGWELEVPKQEVRPTRVAVPRERLEMCRLADHSPKQLDEVGRPKVDRTGPRSTQLDSGDRLAERVESQTQLKRGTRAESQTRPIVGELAKFDPGCVGRGEIEDPPWTNCGVVSRRRVRQQQLAVNIPAGHVGHMPATCA